MNNIDYQRFRARIEHEDNLLNQRTGLFLTANGLGAVAVGLNTLAGAGLLLVAVATLVNLFWLLCGIQNAMVLKSLTSSYIENADDAVDAIVRNSTDCIPVFLNPSSILGIYLPVAILAGWIFGFLYIDIPATV